MIRIQTLIDNAKCYQVVRETRWPDGVRCPHCNASHISKRGKDDTQPHRQRYTCHACHNQFDDLTDTVFAGHHQPLRIWVLCLYFMGLNLSNAQIAQELGLNDDDVQAMTSTLRNGIVTRTPEPTLEGVVEADEVYIVAGHKGHPLEVKKKDVLDGDDA
jgi:transposase-like protein